MAPDCKTCKQSKTNDIPYLAYESALARADRTIRRLWILLIVLVALCVCSNVAWVVRDAQHEDVVTTTSTEIDADQDGEGVNIVGGGDITYGSTGENQKDNDNQDATP